MKAFLLITFSLFFCLPVNSQANDTEVFTQMLHTFLEGASNNDREIHDNFWAEDLIYTSSAGTRFGKAEIMAGFDNDIPENETPLTIFTAEDIIIQPYGDMAVVAFKMKGTTGGTIQYYYNSGTFLKRNNKWQVVNWQATLAQ